jgi:hypothetical protein
MEQLNTALAVTGTVVIVVGLLRSRRASFRSP